VNASTLWTIWLRLLLFFREAFTAPGHQNLVIWATGTVLVQGKHTLVQAASAAGQEDAWKALHCSVEEGCWDIPCLDFLLAGTMAQLPDRLWYGFHVSAGDDTKVHRNSKDVWGTCTYVNYSGRCPNRARTVRAHNWVVVGTLLPPKVQNIPFTFVPQTAELYCRQTQLPQGRTFKTKDQLLVEQFRSQAQHIGGLHLAVFDGGFAHKGVVRPLVMPEEGQPRIDFVTRLRRDACLYELVDPSNTDKRRKKGPALPKPHEAGDWPEQTQTARVFLYGRWRHVSYKQRVCLWSVSGWETPVRVVLACVEGESQPFTLVSSALSLSALSILEIFCARFRQEDGFRDLKQELGWEEGRYWTEPAVLRTTKVVLLVMALLRLTERELEAQPEQWWQPPPWYPQKQRPSVRDVLALFRKHAGQLRALLAAWLEDG
jgi:hypothetical protein